MRDDRILLLAAREAAAFASGLTFAEFQRDRMAQLAILKAVETVGEAASRVSTEPGMRIAISPGSSEEALSFWSERTIAGGESRHQGVWRLPSLL